MNLKALIMITILLSSILTGVGIFNSIEFNNQEKPIKKTDTDGDGIYDFIDAFPNDPAASKDTDNDGYPDYWNEGKNQADSTDNLSIDAFPNDPAASKDTDNDGYPDYWNEGKNQADSNSIPPLELDEFPNDSNAHKDSDKDGYADYYDIYDFANLSIEIKLERFKLTKKVDLLRWAQIYFEVYINGEKYVTLDNNKKYWWVFLNQYKQISHNPIIFDIPDNIDKKYTDIEIITYDFDFLLKDDVIDISNQIGEDNLVLRFDNENNEIIQNQFSQGNNGILYYEITYTESNIPNDKTYNRTYSWNFKNKYWVFSEEIPIKLYDAYVNSAVSRTPQNNKNMLNFVTSNDEVIINFANKLKILADNNRFNSVTTINFILKFVQQSVIYKPDNETKGKMEYWRFPVETLVEKKGDCEDSSVLFASIMDYLNYDTVLLLYSWEENDKKFGHLAVGIQLDGFQGDYVIDNTGKKYYYCETTSTTYSIGEIPNNIKGKPDRIIHIT